MDLFPSLNVVVFKNLNISEQALIIIIYFALFQKTIIGLVHKQVICASFLWTAPKLVVTALISFLETPGCMIFHELYVLYTNYMNL